jgi:hypothetical protein
MLVNTSARVAARKKFLVRKNCYSNFMELQRQEQPPLQGNPVFPYDSLDSLCRKLRLTLPKHEVKGSRWHVVNPPRLGQVHGIPNSRGFLVATDGVSCIIDRVNDQPFYGHVQWFVEEKEETERCTTPRASRVDKYVNSLLEGIV